MENEVLQYLKDEPRFRERANKDRGIVNLLRSKYKVLLQIPKETLIAFIQDANSMDRIWRLMLDDKHYPELRGNDYFNRKKELQQQKMLKLGYEVGYNQDIKLNKRI